jgi:hypothetical protein
MLSSNFNAAISWNPESPSGEIARLSRLQAASLSNLAKIRAPLRSDGKLPRPSSGISAPFLGAFLAEFSI